MTKGEKPTPVAAAFIKVDNKFILLKEDKMDFWRVPGGRLEYGEKIEDTLKREMKEELGIEIKINKFLGFGQDVIMIDKKREVSRIILYFECEIVAGEPKAMEEGIKEIKLKTLDEIKNTEPLEPAMKDFFQRFKDF